MLVLVLAIVLGGSPQWPSSSASEASASVTASSPSPSIAGQATWYPASGNVAAAGPALRRWLGKGWRGTLLRVTTASGSITVVASDYCGCHGGSGRLLDIGDDAFSQLAPLSVGTIKVTITRATRIPPPPPTDTP